LASLVTDASTGILKFTFGAMALLVARFYYWLPGVSPKPRAPRGRGRRIAVTTAPSWPVNAGPTRSSERWTTPPDTFGTVFSEVRIRPRLGSVRASRIVAAYDLGRVLNHRSTRGQVTGGVTWGIGFALFEHMLVDPNTARRAAGVGVSRARTVVNAVPQDRMSLA
jgi:CO/xanthine dehydrogenase Mo-binding subunit